MNAIPWKRLVPVLGAIALFYALCLVYFSPVLEGKQLSQHDIRQWQGMAQEIVEHRELAGEEPLWTGSMFSGMPAYQVSVKWTSNLLTWLDDLFHGFLPRPANFLFLYLLGMYGLLRILKVDPWLSVVGAIAFAFSSYFFVILPAGHTSKANAIGYMPLVFGAVYMLYRGRMLLGAALFALFMGLEIAMNHVQVTYYLGMLLLLFVLAEAVRAFREKSLPDFAKRSALGMVAVSLALACNIGLLWSTLEYGKYSTRGPSELTLLSDGTSAAAIRTKGLDRDYVTQYSYGKQESFTLLVPDAKGGASGMIGTDPEALAKADPRYRSTVSQMNRYWGDQLSTSGPQYMGAVVVLLMLLMLFRTEGNGRWWLLGSGLLIAALVAIGNAAPYGTEEVVRILGIPASVLSGLLVIIYLIAGLFLMRDGLAYALFGALLLTLLLSWGRNLMPLTDFFLDHVPGYNKFRAVTIILVIVELAAPVLGMLYLDRLLKARRTSEGGWDKPTEQRAMLAMGSVLAVLLLMAVLPDTFFTFVSDQEREAFMAQADSSPEMEAEVMTFVGTLKDVRIGFFTADVWRSFAFVAAASVLVLLFGRRKVGGPVLLIGLGALVLLDQWTVDKRYMHNAKDRGRYEQWVEKDAAQLPFQPDVADKAILDAEWTPAAQAAHEVVIARLKEGRSGKGGRAAMVRGEEELLARFGSLRRHGDGYRVLNLGNPFNDARTSYFHRSLGGYHGAKMKRYQELIEFHIAPAVQRVGGLLRSGTSMAGMDSLLADEGVLNMLNTRYLIYSPERPPIRNSNAYGPGWFVDELRWVGNADEEIAALGTVDPLTTAVVDERHRNELGGDARPDPAASVELKSYATNKLTYTVRSNQGGVVVFSEIWYGPDWNAYIDGKPAAHVRADYVLRAMAVPPGEHEVVFAVESPMYRTANTIATASSGLVLLMVLGLLALGIRDCRREA